MTSELVLKVEGMHCGSCVNLVKQELSGLSEVTKVEVDLKSARATLSVEAEQALDDASIAELVKKADLALSAVGFKAGRS